MQEDEVKIMYDDWNQQEAYDEGYVDGQHAGWEDGYSEGHSDGYDEGYGDGEDEGYDAGKEEGIQDERDRILDIIDQKIWEYNRLWSDPLNAQTVLEDLQREI